MQAPKEVFHQERPTPTSVNKKPEVKYLTSWKEIANYLGKGVRTVQRYEAELGLPVRRPAGKSRAGVMATRAEIDAWVDSSPIRAALQRPVDESFAADPELDEIRAGLREMDELRRQMNALHTETRSSLDLLLTGLQLLRKSTTEQRAHSQEMLESALHSSNKLAWHSLAANGGGGRYN